MGSRARTPWKSHERADPGHARERPTLRYLAPGLQSARGSAGFPASPSFVGRSSWWAVPLAVLIGIPIYSNAAGVVPVVQALLAKGAALGTVLAFMMAVIGLSLPETILLHKVLKRRLIAVFIAVVATGILLVGYLFNAIL